MCLHNNEIKLRLQLRFKSKAQNMFNEKANKNALSFNHNKRVQ